MPSVRILLTAMMIGGAVVSATSAAAQAGADGRPKKDWVTPPTGVPALQGFSVVLVVGDMAGESNADDVPTAAKRALRDMRDFLPYKSYRLLDSAWILGSSGTRSATRLRGSDKQEYELSLNAEVVPPLKAGSIRLQASFRLAEATAERVASTALERDLDTLQKIVAGLEPRLSQAETRLQSLKEQSAQEPQLTDARRQFEIALGQLEESRRRLAETQKKAAAIAPKSGATLIGTVFAIDVGETVVVGTSHLGGGQKALIALLTAVPRGKP